jgi:predicted transcriptional regulator
MERAGLVTHDAESQAHRYRPLRSRQEATGSLLKDFVKRFFRGSAERLVLSLVDTRQLSADDLRQIEAQLAAPPTPHEQEPPSPQPRRRRGKP